MDTIKFVDGITGGVADIADPALDPDFESGVSTWSVPTNNSVVQTNEQVLSGSFAAKMITTGTSNNPFIRAVAATPVTVGAQYTLSGWVYSTVATNVYIDLEWYSASDVFVSDNLVSSAVPANKWTLLTVTATAPAGAAGTKRSVGLTGFSIPSGRVLYVDSVLLAAGAGPATATTRLDLNDGIRWAVNYDGTDFSPPPLKQAWSNTLLTDGERLSAAAYANRSITLNMDLIASTPDTVASELQKLWRELNRRSNFLMYQPEGATNPVFFRTIRSSNTRVTELPSGSVRIVEVHIDAEPFGYGPKQQLLTVTVSNNPTAATNAMYFDVAPPKGDVETPLYMAFQGSSVIKQITWGDPPARPMSAIAVRRRGNPVNTPFHVAAESFEMLNFTSRRRSSSMTPAVTVLNANNLFETDVSNWTATGCTLVRDTTQFHTGVASMKLTPTGGIAQSIAQSNLVTIDPAKEYAATAWVRCAVTRDIDVAINWFDSGGAYISTSTFGGVTVPANTWFLVGTSGSGTPAVGATKAAMTVSLGGTPPNTHITYIDEAEFSLANYVRVPTGVITTAWTSQVQYRIFPGTGTVDARGTYRVFMRYRYSGGGSADDIMAKLWWGNGIFNGNVVLPRRGNAISYADMGLVSIPGGYDPVSDGVSGVEIAPEGIYLALQVQETPGTITTSDLDIDHFLLVPADDRLMLVRWQNRINGPAPSDVLLDSATGQVYSRNASGQPGMLTGHEVAGGTPMITPGVTNRVFFALDVGTESNPPIDITASTTINTHYWPRYLTVRPVSS